MALSGSMMLLLVVFYCGCFLGTAEAAGYTRLPEEGGCRTAEGSYEKILSDTTIGGLEECKASCATEPRCMAVTYGELNSNDRGLRRFCHLLENGPYQHADGHVGFSCLIRTDFQCTPP